MQNKNINLNFEIKEASISSDKTTGIIKGYGSIFGNEDSYRDIINPGAFQKSLSVRPAEKIKMLWQHNAEEPIGTWSVVEEDENGLYVEGRLILSVPNGKKAYELLKNNAIDGLSIGYNVIKGNTIEDLGAYDFGVRYLDEVDLWEISVVTFPANHSSTIREVKNEDVLEDKEIIKDSCSKEAEEKKSIAIWEMKDFDLFLKSSSLTNSKIKEFYSRLGELKSKNDSHEEKGADIIESISNSPEESDTLSKPQDEVKNFESIQVKAQALLEELIKL